MLTRSLFDKCGRSNENPGSLDPTPQAISETFEPLSYTMVHMVQKFKSLQCFIFQRYVGGAVVNDSVFIAQSLKDDIA